MRKITTLIAACFIAGTGFAQEQREWKGGQTAGNLWDHVTANWLDSNSSLPFPKTFAIGDYAIFGDKVVEGAETVTVKGEIKTAGVTYKSAKNIKLTRETTANYTTDFLSGTGVLTSEGSGIFAIGVENHLTGGSIAKSGTLRMEARNPNAFGSKIVLSGGTVDLATLPSPTTNDAVTLTTPIEVSEGETGTIEAQRYTYFTGVVKGKGNLVIKSSGDRVMLGTKNVSPDWHEFTGSLTVEKIEMEGANYTPTYYGVYFNTQYTYNPASSKFETDTTFRNKVLIIGSGATIASESGERAYEIGELRSTDETGKLGNYYRNDSNGPRIYWIVGGLNTSVVYRGIIGSISPKNYNATGFIKVGTGTYTLTNDHNLMQVSGLEVKEGKILACDQQTLRGFEYSGSIGGNAIVQANGILGGTGRIQGNVDVYGKFEPGANGIGTLMICDSLRAEADASVLKKMNLNLHPGSVSEFEIKSKDAYDKVEVYGNVSFKTGEGKPTIKVVLPGAYNINDGDQFEIISAFTCNDETIDFNIEYPTIEGVSWSSEIVKLEEDNQNPRIPEGAALKFKVVVKATGSGVGIKDDKVAADVVTLYPNPTYNDFKVSASDVEINSIEVYNLQGQLVKTQVANGSEVTVGVSEIPAGVYIVKVYTTSGIAVQKLVKK